MFEKIFKHRDIFIPAAVFVVAITVRLVYFSQIISTPLMHGMAADSGKYEQIALQMLQGVFTNNDFLFLNPLYPSFLAAIYSVVGHHNEAVIFIQALLDAISSIFVYYCTLIFFNRQAALTASAGYAFYGLAVFYTGLLLAPTLIIFSLLSSTALLLYATYHRLKLAVFFSGILLGLAAACAPTIIITLPGILVWIIFFSERSRTSSALRAAFLFAAGIACVLLLFTIRNSFFEKSFTPFSALGGINFYVGNNPEATGFFMVPPGVKNMPADGIKSSVVVAAEQTGRTLTAAEASTYWLHKGLHFLKDNPVQAFRLYCRKAFIFWRAEEISLNIDYNFCRPLVPLLSLPLVSFGAIAPFALLGLCLHVRRRKNLLLTLLAPSLIFSILLFFISDRHRLAVVPILMMAAGGGIMQITSVLRSKKTLETVLTGCALIAFACALNWDLPWMHAAPVPEQYLNLGRAYMRMHKTDKAQEAFQTALAIDPRCAGAHHFLGMLHEQNGELDKARENYEQSVRLDQNFALAHFSLALVLEKTGDAEGALRHYLETVRIDPSHAAAHFNIGMSYGAMGRADEAITAFENALKNTGDMRLAGTAHFNLSVAYFKKSDCCNARVHIIEAQTLGLAVNPQYLEALASCR